MIPANLIPTMLSTKNTQIPTAFWTGTLTIGDGLFCYGYDGYSGFGAISQPLPDNGLSLYHDDDWDRMFFDWLNKPTWKSVTIEGVTYPISALGFAYEPYTGHYFGYIKGNLFNKTSGTVSLSFTK